LSFDNDINCSNDAITVATKSRGETVESGLQLQKEFQWTVLQTRARFSNNMTSLGILKNVFGHQKFRPGQFDAIEALVSGKDTIVVIPTGCQNKGNCLS
jgi:superfamily II DNA helicase RecQ